MIICNYPAVVLALLLVSFMLMPALAQDKYDPAASVQSQQAYDKVELQKVKEELGKLKSSTSNTIKQMGKTQAALQQRLEIKEFVLTAREGNWELFPGTTMLAYLYNGCQPGPPIRVKEGDPVRIILRNEMKVPTSLYFHGLLLPHSVDGLPRANAGLIAPGETYVYQFIAGRPGTYWYHPQIIHAEQQNQGLVGALVIEPRVELKAPNIDEVMVISQWTPGLHEPGLASKNGNYRTRVPNLASPTRPAPDTVTYFTINGKCAPAIPVLEVHKGDRVRLRLINTAQQTVPLYITGHHFQLLSINGGEAPDSNLLYDSVALQPADRVDLEFIANNPGVWSLSSQLASQATNSGKFPGGLACVLRYLDFKP